MPGYDPLQNGLYAPANAPWTCAISSLALTANRAHIIRVPCPRSMTITKISFAVNVGATADDPCDVGIYDAALNRLGSSGSVSGKLNLGGSALSVVNLQAGVPLVAGQVYYVAFAHGPIGGTAAQLYTTNLPGGQAIFGNLAPNIEQSWMASAFPLPPTIVTAGNIAAAPVMALLQ